ncbi:MAG: amidophosphoribosyltransferase [Alphaproteobacteria bacterium]|nr:amidophosphoribosyltransferase [Alphaproteobacteria bacterium]
MSFIDQDDDKLHEECGVFGIFNHVDASAMTALGLHALQHRGQEACGIITFDGDNYYAKHAFGLVDGTFSRAEVIDSLKGNIAIGHNRYSTTGEPEFRNIQPLYADMDHGGFALCHNGNLTNTLQLREELVKGGSIFQSTSDTEVLVHLVAKSKQKSVPDKLVDAVKHIKGAYSIIAQSEGLLMGLRDPFGIRPLVLGRLGKAYIMTSESCALDIIGAQLEREIEPGEMVVIDKDGLKSLFPFEKKPKRFCIFEYIYFARPDSFMEGKSVYEMRKNIGAELAREAPCEGADIVVPVPDSGVPSAIGFAEASGIPFELGIIRNHYIGRTFIEPSDKIRHLGVKLKHNANRAYIEGKNVVLIDDSIVRGTTSRKIVEMIRAAGAKEVHMRIASPPTSYSCFYGIDTPDKDELLAHKMSEQEICDYIKADSLAYISLNGLYKAVGETKRNDKSPQFCDACFTGDYPVELVDNNAPTKNKRVTGLRNRA